MDQNFGDLWEMINQDGQFLNDFVAQPNVQPAYSSLPAITDWPGDFEFSVTFGPQDLKNAKNINWVFSESEQKLYAMRNTPCPIRFSVSTLMLPGVVVRAMAIYTAPKHASESVHRCPNHVRLEEPDPKKFEADHLIRSECLGATYMRNTHNRHSVVVPFENPSAGQCFSTYIYKFACFSSCSGGPNRRPLTLVFTLEQNDVVLGRRTLNLKICACPGRDSGAIPKSPSSTCPKKMKAEPEKQQAVTVPKRKLEEKNKFTIKTSSLECFEFLQGMKKMFKMRKQLNGLPQEYLVMFNLLLSSSSSGSSEEEEQDGGYHKQ